MTTDHPPRSAYRVAVIGAGPSGFFLAERLLRGEPPISVDLFERLPTPYGLVRYGVAPDHEKIKNVTRSFDKTAARPGFRFFGNVHVGTHIRLAELKRHYHAVCFATGAATDRHLNIPGEDLVGSHSATEFVAWYNGHPDYHTHAFDLSAERVAVIGVGNVAVDVARILCRLPEELAVTDLADHALAALTASAVKEVILIGRRGPAQAAFTNPEVKELGELIGADVAVRKEEIRLDPLSAAALAASDDSTIRKRMEILTDFANRTPSAKPRRLTIRFLLSPVELLGDDAGRVKAIRLQRNRLVAGKRDRLVAEPIDEFETIPVGLVFRSVGYHGVALPDLPFDDVRGVIPNDVGRVLEVPGGPRVQGIYVTGWIKRGPTGVIGTNKPDAGETADSIVDDLSRETALSPTAHDPESIVNLLRERQPELVTWADWLKLDAVETAHGTSKGRPRTKIPTVHEMLGVIRGP
jgi:ferredoxin--NADP+ reductase